MKTILFCGGQGLRIRDYSELVPKPLVPIGGRPILVHLMEYYAQYGHKDFVLCLGYKASAIRDFFLNGGVASSSDCIVSGTGQLVRRIGDPHEDWSIALLDTGISNSIGQRLAAVRSYVENEDMFLANYSDGLTDMDLNWMIDRFRRTDKIAAFIAVRPPLTMHFVQHDAQGRLTAFSNAQNADVWINGGFFVMRPAIFDYMREGEDLVAGCFARLISEDKLMAIKHEGFWCAMDTLKDRQLLEELLERAQVPWRLSKLPLQAEMASISNPPSEADEAGPKVRRF